MKKEEEKGENPLYSSELQTVYHNKDRILTHISSQGTLIP